MRLAVVFGFLLLGVPQLVGEEGAKLPASAVRALESYETRKQKLDEDLQESVEKLEKKIAAEKESHSEELDKIAKQTISSLTRAINGRSPIALQAAVYKEVLKVDGQHEEARGFFETIGTLEQVLQELGLSEGGSDPLGALVAEAEGVGEEGSELKIMDKVRPIGRYIRLPDDVVSSTWEKRGDDAFAVTDIRNHMARLRVPMRILGDYDFDFGVRCMAGGHQSVRFAVPIGEDGFLTIYWEKGIIVIMDQRAPVPCEREPNEEYQVSVKVRKMGDNDWLARISVNGEQKLEYRGPERPTGQGMYKGSPGQFIHIGGGGTHVTYSRLFLGTGPRTDVAIKR